MTGQGEMLGMLHLRAALHGLTLSGLLKSHFIASNQRLALTVAEHISLALSNLKLHETLKNQAVRDPLTGLFNRRYLEETLEREIHKVARTGTSVGIIMIDIDHFKRFNDTYGHDAGDTVLRELGSLLKEKVRAEDIACRYGGEGFTLILPDATEEVTKERAEELRNAFKQLTTVRRNNISLSCGVALFPKHGITGDTILKAADEALYRAKAAGRNQVLVADKILIS
jgi:diguanylate cyclase (GGDEF)-like protein